jgi:hypothetical protein
MLIHGLHHPFIGFVGGNNQKLRHRRFLIETKVLPGLPSGGLFVLIIKIRP